MSRDPVDPTEKIQVIDLARTASIMTVMSLHLKPTLPLPAPFFRWGWITSNVTGNTVFACFSSFLVF